MDLQSTYGSLFIGLIVSSILYGATVLQTYIYYRSYPRDPFALKVLVGVIWVLDTLQLILCTVALYWYLVLNFSNLDSLGKTTWSMNLQTDCNGLIGLVVECFFARRVWMLSKNWILTGLIVVLACIHFGLGIVFTVEEFILVETSRFSKLIWVTSTGLGSAAAADLIIACALCYYLLKNRTGFKRTDSLIVVLIAYSLTTGLITSVLAFICVITFAIMPTNYVWLAFFWVLGKCYVNSLLAALNSRDSLRERVKHQEATFLNLTPFNAVATGEQVLSSSLHDDLKRASVAKPGVPGQSMAVNITTQTFSKIDGDEARKPPQSA